jgi:RNA-binding protein
MTALKGYQKKYLRGIAHGLKPVVQIGREGVTEGVIRAVDEGLFRHELIKIKFNDFRDQKEAITGEVMIKTNSEFVGMIGHTVVLYRQQADSEKRQIVVPARESKGKTSGHAADAAH